MLTCVKVFVYLTNKARPTYVFLSGQQGWYFPWVQSCLISENNKKKPISTFLHNLPVHLVNMSEIIGASQKVETGATMENNTNSYQPRYAKGFKIVFWLKTDEGFVVLWM